MLNEQKGLASLKNALSGAPIDGKDFSDMEDDDDEDEDDDQVHMIAAHMACDSVMACAGDHSLLCPAWTYTLFCNSCSHLHTRSWRSAYCCLMLPHTQDGQPGSGC